MARPDIVFIKGQGASKRVAPGQDYISGLLLYTGSLPSGFTTTNNTKALYSIVDAENAGILPNYADATAATATYLISTKGNTGDTIAWVYTGAQGAVLNLGTYTVGSSDTTIALQGAAWAAIINAGTNTHGCTASFTTATLTVTLPKSQGIFPNSGTPNAITLTGAFAGTLTQNVVAGVASKQAVWHYHISEFFRGNPNSVLWIGFYSVPSTYTFAEITLLQTASGGTIRQMGVYKDAAAWANADLTAINTQVVTYNDNKHKPLSVLYAADLSATSDITTVYDLSTLSANKVSSIIGQDGNALGNFLYLTYGKSITHLGIALGLLSLSAVSEDFGEPAKFNISDGTENAIPAFANGQLLSSPVLSDSALDAINSKRHIFAQQYIGYSGTFFVDNHTAISASSDYAYINDNRVIDKATRGIYTALIPYLKSRLIKNADGTLTTTTIAFLQNQCLAPLYQMNRDGDLSTVSTSDVYIDPTQNVTSTSTLVITVLLNEDAIARNIQIPISYK